jgi:hypothetical protein
MLLVSAAVEAPARDRLWVLRFRHRRAGQLTGVHGYCQSAGSSQLMVSVHHRKPVSPSCEDAGSVALGRPNHGKAGGRRFDSGGGLHQQGKPACRKAGDVGSSSRHRSRSRLLGDGRRRKPLFGLHQPLSSYEVRFPVAEADHPACEHWRTGTEPLGHPTSVGADDLRTAPCRAWSQVPDTCNGIGGPLGLPATAATGPAGRGAPSLARRARCGRRCAGARHTPRGPA